MLLTAQVLISVFILVADADFLTHKSMQELRDPMDWHYQKTSLSRNRRYDKNFLDLVNRLENCCNVRRADNKEKEDEVAKECEDYLVDRLGGKENLAKARQAYPKGVYMCMGACLDQKLGLIDSFHNVNEDAARQYVLSMYESKLGKAEAGKHFEFCSDFAEDDMYKVVEDESITCRAIFRGVLDCVRIMFSVYCPKEAQVESEECEEARQDLKDDKASSSSKE